MISTSMKASSGSDAIGEGRALYVYQFFTVYDQCSWSAVPPFVHLQCDVHDEMSAAWAYKKITHFYFLHLVSTSHLIGSKTVYEPPNVHKFVQKMCKIHLYRNKKNENAVTKVILKLTETSYVKIWAFSLVKINKNSYNVLIANLPTVFLPEQIQNLTKKSLTICRRFEFMVCFATKPCHHRHTLRRSICSS